MPEEIVDALNADRLQCDSEQPHGAHHWYEDGRPFDGPVDTEAVRLCLGVKKSTPAE